MKKYLPPLYGAYFNILFLISRKKAAQKAFGTFCKVRKGRVLPHQKELLDAYKNEVLQVAGHRIQTYHWQGNKQTVLLVHGWESNTFRWRNLIDKLRQHDFNIIAFDAPGHGYSSGTELYVPLYAEILQYAIEKYRPKTVVGHSVAGMTLIYNQYKNPDSEVEKMVTIGSPSELYEILKGYQALLKFNDWVLQALEDHIYVRFGFRVREFSTSDFVRTNPKKGLLFHDKQDKVTPYHASQKVHAHWKNSQLVSTEGLGHSLHQDEVNDRILDFLMS